ncbi:hypothetical protein M2277_004969 [Paenibacillus sp. LBL]|uniref:hypothetical protein n=1 Tax=Paenibacillus sp. LBL TaxID=2940563 RepID=UPI002476FE94|nr:hypothetical protein [Paenibacillus sp. LBL]MDH6674277.1 hypothetical protein [Paenibacillus sp. LBL]
MVRKEMKDEILSHLLAASGLCAFSARNVHHSDYELAIQNIDSLKHHLEEAKVGIMVHLRELGEGK